MVASADAGLRTIGVNVMEVVNGVRAFVPTMVEGEALARDVDIGSKQGINQPPGDTAQNVSTADVEAPIKGLAPILPECTGDRITMYLLSTGHNFPGMMARHPAPPILHHR